MVVSMMFTLVVPVIPDLPRLLSAPAEDASWVVTATLLSSAVFTPVSGRLGDMYGKRRMVVVSLVLMVAGSVVCVVSSSLLVVVLGRALQGCAVGVIPLGISIMRDLLPPERLTSAMALMSATLGAGGAIGLPLGALVAQVVDWHMLFLAAAVMGAVGFVLTLTVGARLAAADGRTVRLPRCGGAVGGSGVPVAACEQGRRLGLGQPSHPGPVRRVGGDPPRVGVRGAAGGRSAGRPAGGRPARGADHERRVHRVRVRHVRGQPGVPSGAPGPGHHWLRPGTVPVRGRAVHGRRRRDDDGAFAGLGPCHRRLRASGDAHDRRPVRGRRLRRRAVPDGRRMAHRARRDRRVLRNRSRLLRHARLDYGRSVRL
ncbi:MFS transporter [Microbispora sp. CA-102843]|uniref:MFS transporter n=1 Tax=Microbispora sp. CA-102843 TaxID=3239952 RepID=UPI003D8D904F